MLWTNLDAADAHHVIQQLAGVGSWVIPNPLYKALCALKSFLNSKEITSIVRVFDSFSHRLLPVLSEFSESKNCRFFLLGKQSESERIASSSCIWNIKEPAVFMKENQPVISKGNFRNFQKNWEPRIHYQNQFFFFFQPHQVSEYIPRLITGKYM